MTSRSRLEELLVAVADHGVAPAEAAELLSDLPYSDLGFARVDTHRELRQGAPEVILGSGKTPDQAARIALALAEAGASSVLVTRADQPMRAAGRARVPGGGATPAGAGGGARGAPGVAGGRACPRGGGGARADRQARA